MHACVYLSVLLSWLTGRLCGIFAEYILGSMQMYHGIVLLIYNGIYVHALVHSYMSCVGACVLTFIHICGMLHMYKRISNCVMVDRKKSSS